MENENHRAYVSFLHQHRDNAARHFLPLLAAMNMIALGVISVVKM